MKAKMNIRHLATLWIGILSLQLTIVPGAGAQKSEAAPSGNERDSIIFKFKGSEHVWMVPKDVTLLYVDAYGAQGGSKAGGKGGRVQSELTVEPGAKLIIRVGGQPTSNEDGYNGGGKGCGNGTGGGGASDIRINGSGLEARVLVAGGGGGVGLRGTAGAGGGLIGGDGTLDKDTFHIAKGGTQTAGGKGARAYFSAPGTSGVGGEGLSKRGVCNNNGMGGGGGGYFGGGGSGAGGAGGGSSYTNDSNHKVVHSQGVREGNGVVKIYWVKAKK